MASGSTAAWHAQNSLLPIIQNDAVQNSQLPSLPPAPYDEQLGITFTQNFTSIAYNVTAIPQTDSYGYGPAYLLNGLSNDGYWYQLGLSYDWPYQDGGYASGFNFNYEVFNNGKQSIYPTDGGGGLQSFSGEINSGDSVLLNLSVSGGTVYMYAKDWNTSAYAQQTWTDSSTNEFIGLSSSPSDNGFFTGLMTEWYHVNPYYGDESQVIYSENTSGLSSAYLWADEWAPGTSWSGWWYTHSYVTWENPTQFQSLSYNGANEFGDAYVFITGSVGNQLTTITLLPAGESTPISGSNSFDVYYTLNDQMQEAVAQNGTLSVIADSGSNVGVSGMSSGSTGTEEWVLDSPGSTGSLNASIPAGSTTTLYYYDILSQQVAYKVSGTANPTPPTLISYTAPSTPAQNTTAQNATILTGNLQTIWVQRGTTATVNNTIAGASQDRWATPTSSWTITQPNQIRANITYYHQYQVTANYTTTDDSVPPSSPSLAGTQFGANYLLPLTTSNQTTWLDENTQWYVVNVTAPTGVEQWVCPASNSGTITQAAIITPTYIHQYRLTVTSPYGSTSGSGWYNAEGTAYASLNSGTIAAGTGVRHTFSSWSSGGANYQQSNAVTMNSAETITASWTTQYQVTFAVTPSGSGTVTPDSSLWANAGTLSISVSPNPGYTFSQWTAIGSINIGNVDSLATTANVNGPGTITATLTQIQNQATPTKAPTQTPTQPPVQKTNLMPEPTLESPPMPLAIAVVVIASVAIAVFLRKNKRGR